MMPLVVGLVMVVEAIVSVPVALERLIPFVLLVDDTEGVPVENVSPIAVLDTTRAPAPPVVLIEPLVTLIVPPPVADMPVPLLVVTASDEKETVAPVLVTMFTPVPDDAPLFTVVAPKLKLAPATDNCTSMPVPVGFTMFVVV